MDSAALKSTIKKYPFGVSIAIVAVLVFGALYYRHLTMSEQQELYNAKSAESSRLANNISHAVQLDDHVRALEEANKVVIGRLVNPQDLAINLQYFYKLEAETGVKLLDTRPVESRGAAKAVVKGVYTPVQYAITLQGRYEQTLAFLRRLERGTIFCRIISGTLGQAQLSGSDSQSTQEKVSDDTAMSLTVELLGRS